MRWTKREADSEQVQKLFLEEEFRGDPANHQEFAQGLLERENVAVLPCDGFGPSAVGYLRIALTAPEPRLEEAGQRIVRFARSIT